MSINIKDLKINSYYLVQSNRNGILALKELLESEYKNAINASTELHSYHYHKRREMEVLLNLDDFFERFNYYQVNALSGNYKDKGDFFVKAYVDLNRVLTNFLSSFRLFVDNLEFFFKKEYGKESTEYLSFRNTIQNEFNSKFEYRLIYCLRNYSQHKGFPINSVGMDNEIDPYTREARSTFTVSFDKERFLKDDPQNFRNVELDFTLYNNTFPVLPQINKIKKSLIVISDALTSLEKNRIVALSNILLGYLKLLEGEGEMGFAQFKSSNVGKGIFDSKDIPMNILREVYRDLEGKEPNF